MVQMTLRSEKAEDGGYGWIRTTDTGIMSAVL